MADEQAKVPVYFIGVEYPADIGSLSYSVRGKVYIVPRDAEGSPDVGAALMADPNDITELVNKARYFNGKKNVEVFTTDQNLAASVKAAFKKGNKLAIEARMGGVGGDIITAPSKEEIVALLTDQEIAALALKRGLLNLSAGQTAPNADASANARAEAVKGQDMRSVESVSSDELPEPAQTAAEKRAAKKAAAEADMAAKLES